MSDDDNVTGAMIASASSVYFIPSEDLDAYRLPDAVAGDVRTWLAQETGEVAGFAVAPPPQPNVAIFAAVSWKPTQGVIGTANGMLHTATRY